MLGQLCTIGTLPNVTRIFYYAIRDTLFIELIDRRDRDLKHLVKLVDEDGNDVPLPKGSRFVHVRSDECLNLLEHHLKAEDSAIRHAH